MKKSKKISVFVTLALSLIFLACETPSSSSNNSGGSTPTTPATPEGGGNTPTSPNNPGNTPTTPTTPEGGGNTPITPTVYYTVTFDSKGGSPVESQHIASGQKASKPANPTKENVETTTYSFGNWYTSNDAGVSLTNTPFDFENTPITADITLYAKWLENAISASYTVKHYKQKLSGNGYDEVTGDRQTISSFVGEQTAATTKNYEGFTAQSFTQKTITANNTVIVEIYYNRNTYTVTYDDGIEENDITVPTSATYRYGETVNINFTNIGSNAGYSFVGWANGSTIFKQNETTTFIIGTENVTLIAKWLYAFHENVTNAENGFLYFGDFPQSLKDSNVIVDENDSRICGDFTYYAGNDGNFYAKAEDKFDRQMKYYKVEPIKWKVLTNDYNGSGKKLLLANNVLMVMQFYEYTDSRGTYANPIHMNNYEKSRIRAYLNGLNYTIRTSDNAQDETESIFHWKGFLYTAFTSSARNKIYTSSVVNNERSTNPDNKYNQWNKGKNSNACNTTKDKILLLSLQEATTASYGFDENYDASGSNNTRIHTPTAFCKAEGTNAGRQWWLRSPYYNDSIRINMVKETGTIYNARCVEDYSCGVLPALCLE